MSNEVNHPSHYNYGKIETIAFINRCIEFLLSGKQSQKDLQATDARIF